MKINNVIKKSIKSLMLVLLLLVIALSFCGCAQVRAITISNDDGTVEELVTISLDTEAVVSAGYSVSELKIDIETKAKAQAQLMKDVLNQKVINDLFNVGTDLESANVLNSYKDGISIVSNNWKENDYVIGIRFKNIDVYKYYYGIKENSKPEMKEEEHFFYNKVYYYASTMYVKHHELYDSVNAYYSTKYPNLITSESNELLYTYKTDLRRQHSDADYITKQDGYYYHTWVVDPNNLDEPIMLYYNIANAGNWIIVSICVTLGVAVVLTIVGVIINLIKKKPEIEIKKEDEN